MRFAVTSVLSLDHVLFRTQKMPLLAGSCGVYLSRALAAAGAEVMYAGAYGDDMPPHLLANLAHPALTPYFIPQGGKNASLELDYNEMGEITRVDYQAGSGANFRAEQLPPEFWAADVFWLGTAPFELLLTVAKRVAPKPLYLTTQNEMEGQTAQLAQLLPHITTLCTNSHELARYGYGDLHTTLDYLQQHYPYLTILVTRGAEGAWLVSENTLYSIPAYPAPRSLNAIGAGDTFAAHYALQRECGTPPDQALQIASAAAALKLGHFGYEKMPTRPN